MKNLSNILHYAGLTEVRGNTDINIASVCSNSARVDKNDLFVAVRGTQTDGHQYIGDAIEKGAVAIVCEQIPEKIIKEITYIKVKDSAYANGVICSNYFDNPSSKLKLTGVTGTNGKTTTATLLYKLFQNMGLKSGLLSTIKNMIGKEEYLSTHTTPDPLSLNLMLSKMVEAGCQYCFMEVSSHATDQKRIAGLVFAGGIFTNITHDHLDYHKTFENYIKAKKSFFDTLEPESFALVNSDDRNAEIMLQGTKAKKFRCSLQKMADFKCKILENQFTGLHLNMDGQEVWLKLRGKFNAYNALFIYATAVLLGMDKTDVLTGLSKLDAVEGRFDCIADKNQTIAIIDYAHTPDALKNVLGTIHQVKTGKENIITVVGAGGDRDPSKRPVMAKIAAELSDKTILTSDNPRSEDPDAIIAEMKIGLDPVLLRNVLCITDRKEAIRTAYHLSKAGDIILIAGKGHEKYQEIKGVKHPFDDKKIIHELMEN